MENTTIDFPDTPADPGAVSLGLAYDSARAFLGSRQPRRRFRQARVNGDMLAVIREAQGVLRREAAWKRGVEQGLAAKARRVAHRAERLAQASGGVGQAKLPESPQLPVASEASEV